MTGAEVSDRVALPPSTNRGRSALARLADVVTSRPSRVLIVTALGAAVAGVFGGPVAGLLSTGDDFSDPGAQAVAAEQGLQAATGEQSSPGIVLLLRTPTDLRTAGPAAVEPVAQRLRSVEGIARVVSYADTRDPGFLSRDGRSTYLLGFQSAQAADESVAPRVSAVFAGDPAVTVGGGATAGPEIGKRVGQDLARAELLAFPILFLLSLLVFRGVVAALLPLFVGVLTILGTFLGLRLVNEATLLSIFALNLATGLGLGLAIDYSLFIVSRYREELGRGVDTRDAVVTTMLTAGRTVLFSGATVAAALLALLVFPQRFLYSMGTAGALSAAAAVTVSLTALPALLMVLGPRVDALAPARWRRRSTGPLETGGWYRLSRAVMRRPLAVALVAGTVLVLAGLPFARISFTGVDATVLPDGAPAKVVEQALRTDFPAARAEPIVLALRQNQAAGPPVAGYAGSLPSLPGVASVSPPAYLGSDTWRIDVTPAAPALDPRTLELVSAVRAAPAPGDLLVGGQSARFVDQQAGLGARLPVALGVLALMTVLILFLMTGSVVLPVKALVMNLLTLSATFGLLVLVFQDGRLQGLLGYTSQGALESTQPLVLLALAFGLSTDYAVFLLARIKEAHDGGEPTQEAVAIGLQRTGRIVTAAALLFSVAIGAFATSQIIFIKQVGLGTAAAVLIDATLVRALLVPSLMMLLGERNWWAPAPLRRLHARIGLAG